MSRSLILCYIIYVHIQEIKHVIYKMCGYFKLKLTCVSRQPALTFCTQFLIENNLFDL